MNSHNAPPKPILTLRVGVTGHRPNKLSDDAAAFLEAQIEAMLQRIGQQLARICRENPGVYAETTPCLRVISALAEGADRVVVSAALRQNCEITAILPFARESYLRDFVEQASRDKFAAFLPSASTIIELDGQYDPPEARNAGYASVGINIVEQTDLLLAIWDGGAAHGHGGTAQIVDYGMRNERPLIWFPSQGKSSKYYGEPMRLLLPDRSVVVGAEKDLMTWLTRLLVPPRQQMTGRPLFMIEGGGASAASSIAQYFAENQRRWPAYRFFDRFQKWMTVASHAGASEPRPPASDNERISPAKLRHPSANPANDFVVRVQQEWNDQLADVMASRGFSDSKLKLLAAHYAWLDQLSTYYAGLHRSAYLINYLLAAGAVMAAATWTYAGSAAELAILLVILVLTSWGMARLWHRRWIEYRDLAEKLRTSRYLRIVASSPVTPQLPPHLVPSSEAAGQTDWLYRAIVRECGLPSIAFERKYLEQVRRYLIKNEVSDQIGYHHRNSERLHAFDHRLHVISLCVFFLAFVAALLHFFLHFLLEGFALVYLSIILPTIGAALFGIRNQGELARVAERSKRMEAALISIRDRLEQSADMIADRKMLESEAQIIAKTMLSETSDWQNLLRARPLELPA